jgi:hypothetical protein
LTSSGSRPTVGIGGPIETVTRPGVLTKRFFAHRSPALTAIGTTGAEVRIASRAPPLLYLPCEPTGVRVPSGNMMIQRPCSRLRRPCRTTDSNASRPRRRSMWIICSRPMPQPKNGIHSSSRLNT